MSPVPTSPRIIIAGGGAIGLSVAYHLGRAGAKHVTLLERHELTAGTTWHAAGIVGPLRSSRNLTELARYGIELFGELESLTGLATGYQQTGGLWLAQNDNRRCELERLAAVGRLHDLDAQIIDTVAIGESFDLLHTSDLQGALWVAEDGQINPVDLCQCYAKAARALGVTIREQASVTAVLTQSGCVSGVTVNRHETLHCDVFINCAGLWAAELGALSGVTLPLHGVKHSYVVTEPVPGLPYPCPIVRDLDSGIYLKGDAGRLVIGGFENNARLWSPNIDRPDPPYLLFEDDWDHQAPLLEALLHRVPAMADIGIQQCICGPESFTPDSRQLMGEVAEVQGYFVGAGFNSIGVMSSAGVGRAIAEWVLNDRAPMDLWEVDVQRFDTADSEAAFLAARIPEAVHNQFALHWPHKEYLSGRYRRCSPWHASLSEEGAVWGARAGWERPLWFTREASRAPSYSFTHQSWWPVVEQEAQALMTTGAWFDLSPLTKLMISGPNALAHLQRCCTQNVDMPIGRVRYTLMLNEQGGIEIECTITRLDEACFLVVSGAATRLRDRLLLQRRWLKASSVTIRDCTEDYAVLGVMGPASRACLENCAEQSLATEQMPFSSCRALSIAGAEVLASRVSYVGELGWELYCPVACAQSVFEAVISACYAGRMVPAGLHCLDSARLEKLYPHWGHDIGPDDSPVEAGLGYALALGKSIPFRGREAIERQLREGCRRQRVLLQIQAERPLLLHDEPVYYGGQLVGATTSGALGFRTGKALSMAMIDVDQGDRSHTDGSIYYPRSFEVDIGRDRFAAEWTPAAPYDPSGSRMRS